MEVQRLGVVYGILNQLSPLVHLYACGAFLFGSSTEVRRLLSVVMGVLLSSILRIPVRRVCGLMTGGVPSETPSFYQKQFVLSMVLESTLAVVFVAFALPWLDLEACGLAGTSTTLATDMRDGLLPAIIMCVLWFIAPRVLPVECKESVAMERMAHLTCPKQLRMRSCVCCGDVCAFVTSQHVSSTVL